MLATYKSYGGYWTAFGGCMLATYKSYGGCWVSGPPLGLYVGNLQVLWWLLDRLWGCMLATYRSYAGGWTAFGAVCMLATYRSYGGCWTAFGAVCWQPTGLMLVAGPPLGLYVGNLQVLCWWLDRLWGCIGNLVVAGFLGRLWGCMLATYRSYGGCWTAFGAACLQPTGLMVAAGPHLGLYVGNLQVLCWLLGFWTAFGAVCWQPTSLMVVAGPPLGLYVGNLQVL